MQCEKRVEDVMNSIFDYPHIPCWFSIRQAAGKRNYGACGIFY